MVVETTIIVPGFMGSSMRDGVSGRKLWDGVREMWTDPRLLRPSEDGLGDAEPGIRVEPLADLWPLHRRLMRRLHRRGHKVLFFPYDWRRPVENVLEDFKNFISKQIPEGRINIAAFSMGSTVSALWLAEGNEERLGRAALLALPAGGSDMAVTAFLLGIPKLAFFNIKANNALLRELALTLPSVYQMLPPLPGIFEARNWPAGMKVNPLHLERAARFQDRWRKSLSSLGRLTDKVALITGSGELVISWRPPEDGRIGPHCRTTGIGDGWMLEESVRVPGLPTYGFRRRLLDSLGLGHFMLLPYILGTHAVLPMFGRVVKAVIEFLEGGNIRTLPMIRKS